MNAEALVGMVLGSCTLQRLVGQGGMGAVFLAQQSRPRRQVAVKVLFPATSLTPNQLAAFLERFRRETDAAASLEHPNIMPVHEYGEENGLAYLVMPYISGGTLRDEMEREGALTLPKVMNYVDQLAAALDFAHERGVIHRDVKPANILKTPEGRLLLTDFGLVKIISEEQAARVRLTGPGAPVGTPDYMSPEQVLGQPVDGRADLYSLGVILYQMVTGTTPFRGDAPMQIAAQHLQTPPKSPRLLRGDLPIAAEQVLLRALAKRPEDRYARGQDLTAALRAALIAAGIVVDTGTSPSIPVPGHTGGRLQASKNLFDTQWQTGSSAAMPATSGKLPTNPMPATYAQNEPSTRTGGLLSRTGMFPKIGTGMLPAVTAPGTRLPTGALPSATGAQPAMQPGFGQTYQPLPGALPTTSGMQPAVFGTPAHQTASFRSTTDALALPGNTSSTMKLTGPVKVVQVPVPGQPGRFVTGLLPVTASPATQIQAPAERKPAGKFTKILAMVIVVMLFLATSGGILWLRMHPAPTVKTPPGQTGTSAPNPMAVATNQANATAQANIILSDPLDHNLHNWPTTPTNVYAFTNGAYHITDRGNNGIAVVLQAQPFTGPLAYSLTMEEIQGNDASVNNSFGMIIRFSQHPKGGKTVTTFYSLEVVNMKGGQYRFYKYDDSKGTANAWSQVWSQNFGNEFHPGHGAKAINAFKVYANGGDFTFTVNGKQVGKVHNTAFPDGTVGMLVNQNGTEVAFQNMLITRN
ncbi:MAG: protein kinase [Ktedonobacteraceae bacterium]|nr:protein kinase [Ktedonobacteraceae bacterium]